MNNLERRLFEHQEDVIEGFTTKYHVHHLVYYEVMNNVMAALQREKQLKKWNRRWKLELIEKENPEWRDLITGQTVRKRRSCSFLSFPRRRESSK